MIFLTKFTGERILVNPDLIKSIEAGEPGGDTVVTLVTGDKLLVSESPEEIQDRFLRYKQTCHTPSSSFSAYSYSTPVNVTT